MSQKIILATTSPYRREAFEFLGIPFRTEGGNVEEQFKGRPEKAEELVRYLAKLKARAVAQNKNKGIIIGFDSVGEFQGQILEKPRSKKEGYKRLKLLSGQRYDFYTGIHLINLQQKRESSKVVKTNVQLREISSEEINKYLEQDPNFKTYAQGFDPLQTYGSTFVERINGSYNNILRGIPLEVIVKMLSEEGVK